MCVSSGWTLYVQFGAASYIYQFYFRFANLLDDSDFTLSSLLDGGGPSRNQSTHGTVLSLIGSFNGWWCGNNPLILSRNDKDFEDSPTTFTSSFVSIDFSSSKWVSFSGTSLWAQNGLPWEISPFYTSFDTFWVPKGLDLVFWWLCSKFV